MSCVLWAAAVAACCWAGAGTARAGMGPENVVVVVNAQSWASLTIANHFVALRQIPPTHVFYLTEGVPPGKTNIEQFRAQVLGPVMQTIAQRGLGDQIDAIVYSADLPYAIDVKSDLVNVQVPKQLTPTASINGLTYLWQLVMAKNPNYLGLQSNQYMRRAGTDGNAAATHGFRGWYGWGPEGRLLEVGGQRYMLSTMLGMTSGRGNAVREVLAYLSSAAAADGTHPKGTIYFAQNSDIRSQARDRAFPAAVTELQKLGVRAEIVHGVIPMRKLDVQGAMIGAPKFDWASSGSKILPGAICEHFTSSGGNLEDVQGQTPLTELLRFGAAGASGTVAEPYAIGEKFPLAMLHVHYARGCTLAEAFYQSVFGPYQLLIVGDPLCRPWANIPRVAVGGVQPGATLRGSVSLSPSATVPGGGSVDRFELFADGLRRDACAAGEMLELDTTSLVDGYHEFRVVGIEDSAIESQGRALLPVRVANRDRTIEFTVKPGASVPLDGRLTVTARSSGAKQIEVYTNTLSLGTIRGDGGSLEIEARRLGLGTVALQALAVIDTHSNDAVVAEPLRVKVERPTPLPALKVAGAQRMRPGLLLKAAGGTATAIADTSRSDWLEKAGVAAGGAYTLDAYFDVSTDDVYQFQVRHNGALRLEVDGKSFYDATQKRAEVKFIPVSLARGTHRLNVRAQAAGEPKLTIWFGGPGAHYLRSDRFRHLPGPAG